MRMPSRNRKCLPLNTVIVGIAGLLAWGANAVHAGTVTVIDDRSFFDHVPHTLIDFETRVNGTSIVLGEGSVLQVFPTEYEPMGVRFEASVDPGVLRIGNDASLHHNAAESIIGSPDNSVAPPGRNGWFDVRFVDPVHAFGISIINRSDGLPVELLLFDGQDQPLTSISFTGSLVDGAADGLIFGNTFSIEYGFVGAYDPLNRIHRVRIMEDLTALDDLHFSVVPEPLTNTLIVIAVTSYVASRLRGRRRRQMMVAIGILAFSMVIGVPAYSQVVIQGFVQGKIVAGPEPVCGPHAYFAAIVGTRKLTGTTDSLWMRGNARD